MAETNFPLTADEGHDDLPRTFRRAREEKEREAKAREAANSDDGAKSSADHSYIPTPNAAYPTDHHDDGVPATVKRFDVPFLSLMMFFIKAVLAAIPALILLGALIWLAGEALQTFFPWLVKMQIFIQFPD